MEKAERAVDPGSGDIDLSAFWMPFTDNRAFKRQPRLLSRAAGMYYYTPEGRAILDSTAGLWCVNAGHCHPRIVDAIRAEAGTLDFAPTFQLGHPIAFRCADAVARIMPPGLDRIFFTNSGSESADTALKIALAYQRAVGQTGRYRLIGRQRGYHGTNFGGMSVGGIGGNRSGFASQVWGVDHLSHTYRASAAFTRGLPPEQPDLAQELEQIIALHGAETIAALIVEPLAGSTGVLVPPRGYLQQVREITERHGILLIFDEVITGFGRLGAATAAEYFGVVPDIITAAKGLTSGTVPMGAVIASRKVHDAVIGAASGRGIEFMHGYTYSGHPLAAAAALATLEVYAEEALFERAATISPRFERAIHALRDAPHVTDIRTLGLVAGIELAPRPGDPGIRAMEAFHRCFDDGVLVRVTGDIIALSPPLTVTDAQIDETVSTIRAALEAVA